ncbi:MAG: hypothetical protein IKB24_03650 [Alistipes sp.]|nr:hypothetical protein [Alistipes sp.]
MPDQTRTFLGEGNTIYWNVGDQLTVFSKSDHNLKYQIAELEEGSTTARFTYTREYVLHSGTKFQRYVAAFPFDEATTVDPSNGVISMMLPSTQFYDAARDFRYVPLTAVSTSMNMNFVAPSSVLRLRVNKDNPNEIILKRVIVESASQYIAGMVDINMMDATPVAVVNESLDIPSKSIVLDFGSGVELTDELQQFYIALPVTNFGVNDLKITCVYDMNGDEFKASKTYDKEVNFKVASIKSTNITITNPDVNGSTVDGDLVVGGNMELDEPLVVPSGEVTITVDGKLTNSASNPNSALIVVGDDATLTIDGSGSIETIVPEAQATALSATRATFNSAFPIVVNGTLRIKGGRFTLNSYATSWLNCGIYVGPKGKLIIEGGRFHSPKGSFIFGHEHGNRPEIIIHGGRFEGYDPSDNDFDGNGSNYLEPEYASYYVAENELVVAERTANWEVDNNYLLNSILKNGGNATLIDSVHDSWAFNVDNNINVNYPVNISVSGDPSKLKAECILYIETPINCYADVNIKGDSYDPNMLYIDSIEAIANVYNGATLTLGEALYFGGGDEVSETLFNLYGGNIVVNDGSYTLSERINAANMFVIDSRYAEESSLVVNGGVFYGFDPSAVTVGEEVKSYVAEGLSAYEVSQLEYGIYPTGSAFDVDNFYLLRSIFKNGGRANISGEIKIEESLVALNPVVLNMGGSFYNYLNYSGDDAMMKCYSDVSLIADVNNDQPYVYSKSVVAEVYENVKFEVNMYNGVVTNDANAMFVANGGQIDIYSGLFTAPGGFLENEELANSEISVYGGNYYNFNPEAFVGEGYAVKDSNGYYEVYPVTF